MASSHLQIFTSFEGLSALSGPLVLVAGTFDGVHLGHQALIRSAQEEAVRLGGEAVVMTFDRHPAALLRPQHAPRLLTSTSQKLEFFEKLGIKKVLLMTFDEALAAIPAEEFIRSLVASAPSINAICMGATWSFGQGAKGNISLLRSLGDDLGFSVMSIAPVLMEGVAVSSTRVRCLIAEGKLEEVSRCLGRPYALRGTVVKGRGLGKQLGFPTANLKMPLAQLPPDGVYAVTATIKEEKVSGVANIGCRPTIDPQSKERVVEVHLFDFSQNIVGEEVTLELGAFLREEKKFPSLEELQYQICSDIDEARKSQS